MEAILLGIYALLRLADLHQAQVAAVEHHEPGDRGDHPDRRADGADPAAQRLRAVLLGRARVQVHRADRVAGARPGDRGAGRGGQPAGEEGRRAVPDRSHALSADGQPAPGAARQRARRSSASWTSRSTWPRPRWSNRARAIDQATARVREVQAQAATCHACACSRTASWRHRRGQQVRSGDAPRRT